MRGVTCAFATGLLVAFPGCVGGGRLGFCGRVLIGVGVHHVMRTYVDVETGGDGSKHRVYCHPVALAALFHPGVAHAAVVIAGQFGRDPP